VRDWRRCPEAADITAPMIDVELGKIGILVNNAARRCGPPGTTDEMWQSDLDLKLFAQIVCKLVFPQMKPRNWGRIISILNIGKAPAPTARRPRSAARHRWPSRCYRAVRPPTSSSTHMWDHRQRPDRPRRARRCQRLARVSSPRPDGGALGRMGRAEGPTAPPLCAGCAINVDAGSPSCKPLFDACTSPRSAPAGGADSILALLEGREFAFVRLICRPPSAQHPLRTDRRAVVCEVVPRRKPMLSSLAGSIGVYCLRRH
jgi:hypothetical protein